MLMQIQIDSEIPEQHYLDGTCFGMGAANQPKASMSAVTKPFKPPMQRQGFVPPSSSYMHDIPMAPPAAKPIPAATFFGSAAPKRMIGIGGAVKKKRTEARFDPGAPGAVVMKRPGKELAAKQ